MCFGRPVTSAVNAGFFSSRAERAMAFAMILLALDALLVEHLRDLLVQLGLEVAERQVLQLPLELPDAEPVGERRVDVERSRARRPSFPRTGSSRTSAASACARRGGSAPRGCPRPCRAPSCAGSRSARRRARRASARAAGRASTRRRRARRPPRRSARPGARAASAGTSAPRTAAPAARAAASIRAREVGGQAERVRQHRLAGGEQLALVERLGERERALDERALGRLEARERGFERGLQKSDCVRRRCALRR